MSREKIRIVGGGAAAIAFALFIDTSIFKVELLEKEKTLGRKFLVAGKGGFNLTHGSPPLEMVTHYLPSEWMTPYFESFTNIDFRSYLKSIGIDTFIGSSNRVFPVKGIKPYQLLETILSIIEKKGIHVSYNTPWPGFKRSDELEEGIRDYDGLTIFALGGASWAKTGSDGTWYEHFRNQGIHVNPFLPSNCGWEVEDAINWTKTLEGVPLKNIEVYHSEYKVKGELRITNYGLEGGAIYKLSPSLRRQYIEEGSAVIEVDFKPNKDKASIYQLLSSSNKSITDILKSKVKLSKAAVQILKQTLDRDTFTDPKKLSALIKRFPIALQNPRPIDEAISTVGGVDRNELDENLQLIKLPKHYCIGEMIDWDAPTGGYLLQACFSMGYYLANYLNEQYRERD
jgi:uncharacterized flavoprotein (TIGR03862 family)